MVKVINRLKSFYYEYFRKVQAPFYFKGGDNDKRR